MSIKLTPLNIALACVLAWVVTEWFNEEELVFSWLWLITLVFFLSIVDVLFRIRYREVKKIWLLQLSFLFVVALIMIIIKLQ